MASVVVSGMLFPVPAVVWSPVPFASQRLALWRGTLPGLCIEIPLLASSFLVPVVVVPVLLDE